MQARDDALLSQALRGLPLEQPPAQGWAELHARLRGRSSPPRGWRQAPWWMAVAASLLVLLAWPGRQSELPPAADTPVAQADATAAESGLAGWIERSRQLEEEIRFLQAGSAAVDEMQYAFERAIQDELALVDLGLQADQAANPELWQRRIRLLEELRDVGRGGSAALLLYAQLD